MQLLSLLPLVLGAHPLPPVTWRATEEVEWFKSSWYVGAGLGIMNANASGADLDSELARQGYVTSTDLDDTGTGWKIYAGYRFESPWALELGYADLGKVESKIQASPPNLNAFLRDLADAHPYAGQGITASGQYFFLDTARVAVGLRGGMWLWESDVDARGGGGSADVDESGLDPFFGASLLIDLTESLQLRAEYEKYFVDGEDVDFLSMGVQVLLL